MKTHNKNKTQHKPIMVSAESLRILQERKALTGVPISKQIEFLLREKAAESVAVTTQN